MSRRKEQGTGARDPKKWEPKRPGRCNVRKKEYKRCRAWPKKGDTMCAYHRRKYPRDAKASAWRGGISRSWQANYLPPRILERFEQVVNDPDLISVRHLLATTSVRLTELYEKLPERESGLAWLAIGEALEVLEAAELEDAACAEAVATMRLHWRAAMHERAVWREIFETMEQARKLADTERRREEMLQASLTAQQSVALFAALFQLLVDEIADVELRGRIGRRLRQLVTREAPGALPPAAEDPEEA